MRLLLYPVTLILSVAISIATPPPGYVEPPNNDKDPPRYEYKYEIGNGDAKGSQGKTESRSGELASGRYYVNGETSSTDVKYYADEWGYHPLVKYRITNDHSVATTHFASGEQVVKSLLLNGTEVGEELPALRALQDQPHRRLPHRHRHVQLVQPYTPESGEITVNYTNEDVASSGTLEMRPNDDTSDLPNNYNDQGMLARASNLHQPAVSTTTFRGSFHNYVTLPQTESVEQYQSSSGNERDYHAREERPVSNMPTTPVSDQRTFEPTSISVGHTSTTSSLSDLKLSARDEDHPRGQETANNLSSTLSDDILIVENAGSFGRRIKPTLAAHQEFTEDKTRRDIASSPLSASYEISTSKPILRISDKSVGHGVSSFASMNVPTARPINALSSNNVERPIVASNSANQDVNNPVVPKVSSINDRSPMSGVGYREDSASDSYAGIFAKIFPNALRDHEIGESVNSLISSNWQLSDHAIDEKNTILIRETERARQPELLDYEKGVDHQLYVTLKQSLESEIRDSSNARSSTPATPSTYSSKPIVVAELTSNETNREPGYSTTFPCHDEETSTLVPSASSTYPSSIRQDSVGLLVTPKLQVYQSPITTSSVILNPIQAGIRLVNADQVELIGGESPPAPVTENLEGDSQASAVNHFPTGWGNELGKIVAEETRSNLYETINPAFGQPMLESESIGVDETTSNSASYAPTPDGNQEDQQIEIQKSVEIYQNAPVREIHYLPQVITQVSGINHIYEQGVKQQRENIGELVHERDRAKEAEEMSGSYVELQDAGNAKQLHDPPQVYSREEEPTRESHGTPLSLGNIRDSSLIAGSVYHGNLVRQDNELADYPIERNNGLPMLLPGDEDAPSIIQLIRDRIPEVKYTVAKTPRINVKVYPTGIQANDSRQADEWQPDVARFKTTEQSKKMLSPLQKILSESDSVQRYFGASAWSEGDEQVVQHQHQSAKNSPEEPESYQLQENVNESGVRHPEQQPLPVLPWAQLYTGVRNHPGSLNNAIQAVSNTSRIVLPSYHSSLVTGERIVEKTVHVPQPYPVEVPRFIEKKVVYPVEKIIERKVPYPVEKIIEKKVPYPIHIQVPVDRVIEKQVQILQPYPVHIEKIIEKKVPYPVQRLVPQPYPVHILQPYPVEKIIEKPVHVPVTVEKIVEKKVHVPQPYPVQVPIKLPYPVEVMKYVENTVPVPYGVRYGVSYQQIMKPQSSKGLYGGQSTVSVPLYGVSLVSNHNRDRGYSNATQEFQGYNYDKPAIPFVSGAAASSNSDHQRSIGWENFSHDKPSSGLDNIQRYSTFGKKAHHGYAPNLPFFAHPIHNYSGTNRRHAFYRQNDDKPVGKDEYVGPVPSLKANTQLKVVRSRSSVDQPQLSHKQRGSTAVTRAVSAPTSSTSSRRARQQDNSPHYQNGPGAFRQSKIEYGFKPPMVPSVQYDEKTATKVDK